MKILPEFLLITVKIDSDKTFDVLFYDIFGNLNLSLLEIAQNQFVFDEFLQNLLSRFREGLLELLPATGIFREQGGDCGGENLGHCK